LIEDIKNRDIRSRSGEIVLNFGFFMCCIYGVCGVSQGLLGEDELHAEHKKKERLINLSVAGVQGFEPQLTDPE